MQKLQKRKVWETWLHQCVPFCHISEHIEDCKVKPSNILKERTRKVRIYIKAVRKTGSGSPQQLSTSSCMVLECLTRCKMAGRLRSFRLTMVLCIFAICLTASIVRFLSSDEGSSNMFYRPTRTEEKLVRTGVLTVVRESLEKSRRDKGVFLPKDTANDLRPTTRNPLNRTLSSNALLVNEKRISGNNRSTSRSNVNSFCKQYKREISIKHKTYVNYFNITHPPDDRVCLLSQLSQKRMEKLLRLAEYWKGSMSIAVYVNATYLKQSIKETQSWLTAVARSNIAIHYVIQQGEFYPVNKLRNVAQSNAMCDYVFMVDIDFLPSKQLEHLIAAYIDGGFYNTKKKRALVVPALEMLTDDPLPEMKEEIVSYIDQGKLQPFHFKKSKSNSVHGPTNYAKWKTAKSVYKIQPKLYYEPYVVIRRTDSPKYDERFLQRFYNKISHIYLLMQKNVEFWAIPEGCLIHTRHEPENVQTQLLETCLEEMWRNFQRENRKSTRTLYKH